MSYVHGDLNAANILVDAHDNVWVIDFFHTGSRARPEGSGEVRERPALSSSRRVDDDAQLQEAIAITLALRKVADLHAPLAGLPDDVRSPQFVRAWEILRVLRNTISEVIHDDRNPLQLPGGRPALRRSHAGLPGAVAAAEAVGARRRVLARRADRYHRGGEPGAAGRLGRIPAHRARPPRDDDLSWTARIAIATSRRTLSDCAPRAWNACCACPPRLSSSGPGVPDLGSRAEAFGLDYRWLPVPDQGTCSLSEAVDLVRWCRDGLERGESIVLTCMGGLGRSGMIAACTLVDARHFARRPRLPPSGRRGARARSRRRCRRSSSSKFAVS